MERAESSCSWFRSVSAGSSAMKSVWPRVLLWSVIGSSSLIAHLVVPVVFITRARLVALVVGLGLAQATRAQRHITQLELRLSLATLIQVQWGDRDHAAPGHLVDPAPLVTDPGRQQLGGHEGGGDVGDALSGQPGAQIW